MSATLSPPAPSSVTAVVGTAPGTPTVVPTASPAVSATSGTPAGSVGQGTPSSSAAAPAASVSGSPAGSQVGGAGPVVGAVVRFSAGATAVEVTIGEHNPTVRDFLSLLPLTLTLEEFAGKEKPGYPPRRLASSGSPGSDPEDGDLIYYIPWGNLGFYYDASGIGYSDQTIHIGEYTASRAQLDQLASQPVTVEAVRR